MTGLVGGDVRRLNNGALAALLAASEVVLAETPCCEKKEKDTLKLPPGLPYWA